MYSCFLALAALSGVGVALSAPGVLPTSAIGWLAWIALVPLLAVIPEVSPRRAALLGWVASMALQLVAGSWFPGLLARFGGLHPALAVLATLLILGVQSLGWAAWAGSARLLVPRWPLPFVAPVAFVAMEYAMPLVFPYALGLTQYANLPIAQAAEVGGIVVVSGLVVAFNAACAEVLRSRGQSLRPALVAGLVVVLSFGSGFLRLSQVRAQRIWAPSMRVGWVQAGVAHTGWQAATEPDRLADYQRLSRDLESEAGRLDLLLWPEKVYGLLLRGARHDYDVSHRLRIRKEFESPLLFGHTSVDPKTRDIRNAAAFLESHGRLRVVYEKVRLIPYSEWLPTWLEDSWGKRYRPGESLDPVDVGGVPVGVFICFESTFPGYVRQIARRATVLVNLSDDAWFGDTAEPEQHLAHTVFRAIENRRDLVRATGAGVSALVAATGEVLVRTELNRDASEAKVGWAEVRRLEGRSVYGRAGDTLPILCSVGWLLLIALRLRARGQDWPPSKGIGIPPPISASSSSPPS